MQTLSRTTFDVEYEIMAIFTKWEPLKNVLPSDAIATSTKDRERY
jgi:hypothetical protein